MDFDTWEPVYERILADFGFDRGADERARDVAADLATPFDLDRLAGFEGASVAVAGAGPTLPDDVAVAAEADRVVAASTAAGVLGAAGVDVDLVATDLDKHAPAVADLTREGVPVAVHAHGDNVGLVREWLPRFDGEQVLATTQARPVEGVANFGGFTDGDRAAFLADALGAADLRFPGWSFDDDAVDPTKARKLDWAERLLYWLEARRGARFDLLDGRRAALSLPTE